MDISGSQRHMQPVSQTPQTPPASLEPLEPLVPPASRLPPIPADSLMSGPSALHLVAPPDSLQNVTKQFDKIGIEAKPALQNDDLRLGVSKKSIGKTPSKKLASELSLKLANLVQLGHGLKALLEAGSGNHAASAAITAPPASPASEGEL